MKSPQFPDTSIKINNFKFAEKLDLSTLSNLD